MAATTYSRSATALVAGILDLAKAALNDGHAITMRSSAELNYMEACNAMWPCWDSKHPDPVTLTCVARRALRSLVYSVGKFHPDYAMAANLAGELALLTMNVAR